MAIVVDASTALAAVLADEDPAFARAAIAASVREGLVVPALWMYEVQNALASALRRKRLDATSADEVLSVLRALPAEIKVPQGLDQEFRLASTHGLTAYDAAYLGVALNLGARLATNDMPLRRTAGKLGVALFSVT